MSSLVSWIVIIGTLGSLIGFVLLLYMNRKTDHPGETTGHVYDGIEEYDNPLPAWWFWSFLLSIIFGLAYLAYYPGLGNFAGLGEWTQLKELKVDQIASDRKYGPIFEEYKKVSIDDLSRDSEALKVGRRLFSNNCVMCHGSSATGATGFPNLVDDEWMWGGSTENIKHSILKGRNGVMAAWGGVLQKNGVEKVTTFVLSLAGRDVDAKAAKEGESLYMTYCFACHGADGKGQALFGAPDLTNEIWLYGNSRSRIESVISEGRSGTMPSFERKLGEGKVHILAAYIKSLSTRSSSKSE